MILTGPCHGPLGASWSRARQLLCRRFLHWPASPNPSPYQIFGLSPGTAVVDKKKLQAIYFQLVKTYHPDRGATGDADRFKKVVEAHNILKDDAKRRSYDITQHMSHSAPPRYHPQRHNAFEDDIDVNYWSNQGQQAFDQGLYESRVWVLKLIVTLAVVFAVLDLLFLRKVSEIRTQWANAETERVAAHLAEARGLSGSAVGNRPSDRIARFLEHRQSLLDKFDHEFSYGKLRGGSTRAEGARVGDTAPPRGPGTDHEEGPASPESLGPRPSNGIGKRQAKPNTGPVAEYFGRD